MVYKKRETEQGRRCNSKMIEKPQNTNKAIRKVTNKKEERLKISLLNVQGLSKQKLMEVEQLIEMKHEIVCLTETHQKIDKLLLGKGLIKVESMRNKDDKKGGGLMAIGRKNKGMEIEKLKADHEDILLLGVTFMGIEIKILIVYFAAGNKQDDKQRNAEIKQKCENIIENINEEALIIMGDFNGHVGFIGHQKADAEGEMVLRWVNDYGLILLNGDERCNGTYTWEARGQKSAIDFIIVNRAMYRYFSSMNIDENRLITDISDHNLIQTIWDIRGEENINYKKGKKKERIYCKTDPLSLEIFIRELEKDIGEKEITRMENLNASMRKVMQENLMAKYKRRSIEHQKIEEPPWINEAIRTEIKKRKKLNREKRNETNEEQKIMKEEQYIQQKRKTQLLVNEAVTEYEKELTEEIKRNKNKLWENINKLRNSKEKKGEELQIYKRDGEILPRSEVEKEILNEWEKIYRKHDNKIDTVWNEDLMRRYKGEMEDEENKREIGEIPNRNIIEHLDAAMGIVNAIIPMESPTIDIRKVRQTLKQLRNNKAAGPDGLKPELYKAMEKSELCLLTLTECLRTELKEREKPSEWKKSKTKMIGKKKKPTAKDLRPVALTNVSYKIFMSLCKNEIEEHVERCQETKETQAGFTKGAKIEDNLFILQHCVEECYRQKKQLIVIAIDFRKAFDSVKRETLIEAMMKYKMHPQLIETVAKIYSGDSTTLDIGGNNEVTIEVTSGIRQGCTGSPTLFKLVTYMIMKELEERTRGFETELLKICCLFFADDGLILAETIEQAIESIKILVEASRKCGLEINKEKSNILIYNMKEKPEYIEDIKIESSIKYLGVTIDDNRNIFKTHKKLIIEKAQKLANLTYSIIGKSCNKVMVGKTYWKNVALPSILYGTSIVPLTETEINKLQIIENGVYRQILGAAKYTARSTLRGEIGASSMKARVIENRLRFIKSIIDGNKEITKTVLYERREKNGKWWRETTKAMEEVNMKYADLKKFTAKELKQRMKDWDTEKWREEMKSKSSISVYRERKINIKEETCYDNKPESIIWFKARTNSLPLNDRKRHTSGETGCQMCGEEVEDLTHFLLFCREYNEDRKKG